MSTLYEQIGGKAAVEVAVDKFYDRVMADDLINFFFAGIDMKKQRSHQIAFLTYAFGSTSHYDGRSMQQAHQRLAKQMGLTDVHFDAVVEDLATMLQELSVPDALIAEVGKIAESTRADVLSRN